MTLDDLIASAGVLPISEKALHAIIEDLHELSDTPAEEFVDAGRYCLRAVGAIVPPTHFDALTIGRICGIDVRPYLFEVLEALTASGPYEGEASVNSVRQLIGLVDDGIAPSRAARHLGIREEEFHTLASFLDLDAHWRTRLLDKLEVLIHDNASIQDVREALGTGRLGARFLLWWARWTLRNSRLGRVS